MTKEVEIDEALGIINDEYECASASISFQESAVILSGRLESLGLTIQCRGDEQSINITTHEEPDHEVRLEIETSDGMVICEPTDAFEIGTIGLFAPDDGVI